MKSIIKSDVGDKQEEIVFPVLMECKVFKEKLIVMFTNATDCVVVYSQHKTHKAGDINKGWIGIVDTDTWKKFTGVIELSN